MRRPPSPLTASQKHAQKVAKASAARGEAGHSAAALGIPKRSVDRRPSASSSSSKQKHSAVEARRAPRRAPPPAADDARMTDGAKPAFAYAKRGAKRRERPRNGAQGAAV